MKRVLLTILFIGAALVYAAICLHSVQEIHYLKSFFPGKFTVEEAFYASAVELVKVVIIGIPILAIMALCAFFLGKEGRK